MFVVVYHATDKNENGYSHFVGVANSYANAEAIIEEDKMNVRETRDYVYHIEEVILDCACPFAIEPKVREQPYTR
jgi:hypothetical protein